jgi:hypothetical protein
VLHRRGLAAVPSTLVSATRASHDPPPGEETHAGHPRTSTGRYKSSRLRSVIDFIEPISSGVRRTGIAHLPEPAGRKHCRVWLAPLFIKGRSDSAEPVDSISWVGRCAQKAGNAVTAWNRVETNRDPASLHQPPVLGSARAVTPPTPASAPSIAVGLLVTFAEWQPRDGTAPNWPGTNGRPLRGCRAEAAHGKCLSERAQSRTATVEQLQAPTSGTPHRVGAGGRSASIGWSGLLRMF